MTDNVTDFPGATRLTTPVPKIRAAAAGARLQDVVVIGWDRDGNLYFASSDPDGAEVNWMLDQAKQAILETGRQ